MSEFPIEDAVEQATEVGGEEDTDYPEVIGPREHSVEVDPVDAAEQELEVPVDEDEWR
jgi:hypothetical protein